MKEKSNEAGRTTARRTLRPPLSLVFFAAFYLYVTFEIQPHLIYHGAGLIDNFPVFYKGWDFFREFTTHPGGLIEYVSAFLSQFFYYSWAGAAVITGQAWLICLCIDYAIRTVGMPRWRGLRFVAPLLLLAIYSQYTFHLPETMGLLVALVAFCLYLRLAPKGEIGAGAWLLGFSTGLYAFAGGAFLLFALLCGLVELLFRGRVRLGAFAVALGLGVPYLLGVIAFGQRPHDAYFELLPLSWKFQSYTSSELMEKAVWVMLLLLPAALLAGGIVHLLLNPTNQAKPSKKANSATKLESIRKSIDRLCGDSNRSRLGLDLRTALLIIATAVTLMLCRASKVRTLFEVDYFSRQGQWDKVLEIGRKTPYHYLVCHAIDRALFHTGKLGGEMFCFPQRPEALFLTQKEALWQKFDTCMDIGMVNQAENALMICLETYGERPLLLQRLAQVNLIKGNISTAQVYLKALEKVPFWGSAARARLAQLETDPQLSQDADIQHWRSVMLRRDFVRDADTLTLLLTENPENRMAYEYGMASLLLSKKLDQFEQNVKKFRPASISANPSHYIEAILLSRALHKQPIDVPGQTIPKEAKVKLHEFFQVIQQHGTDKAAARAASEGPFGDTYYHYYFFAD